MERAREIIGEVLTWAKKPCVLSSFGKDSMLLLTLLREQTEDFSVVWYRHDLTVGQMEFAKEIIRDWDLTVYSYAPFHKQFIPNGKGLSLVSDYSINGELFPVLVDIEEGDRCSLELSRERTPYFSFSFDAIFMGYKATDSHPAVPDFKLPDDGFTVGGVPFYAPLRHLTDSDVWDAIKDLSIPTGMVGDDLQACTKCFTNEGQVYCPAEKRMIDAFAWNGRKSLDEFRARFSS